MRPELITIGVCTYNRANSLRDYALRSFEKLTYVNFEIIVIDDCSPDETQQVLAESRAQFGEKLRVFRNERNRGLPYSRNRILDRARGDVVVFADDDVSLFPDSLDKVAEFCELHPTMAMAWGCVYQCHGNNDWHCPTFGTGSLMILQGRVAKNLRFDTNIRYFKTYGCEEHEFARRIQRVGLPVLKAPNVRANHYQAPSKDRAWRGLGGNLNHLYEQVKFGSVGQYYTALVGGIPYVLQKLAKLPDRAEHVSDRGYEEARHALHHWLVFLRERRFSVAARYCFYLLFDIPVRATIARRQLVPHALHLQAIARERSLEAAPTATLAAADRGA